jgi:hypothetical protein
MFVGRLVDWVNFRLIGRHGGMMLVGWLVSQLVGRHGGVMLVGWLSFVLLGSTVVRHPGGWLSPWLSPWLPSRWLVVTSGVTLAVVLGVRCCLCNCLG